MMRMVFVLAGVLFLSACAVTRPGGPAALSSYAASDYGRVFANTRLVPDPHTGWTTVYGPVVSQFSLDSKALYFVMARIDGGKTSYGIMIAGLFPKRVYLGDVYSQGRKLRSKVVDRERRGCGYDCTTVETVIVLLTEAEMERYASEGIELKAVGRRDSIVVSVPASYFSAVLAFHRRRAGSVA